jgi:hypothetical protein
MLHSSLARVTSLTLALAVLPWVVPAGAETPPSPSRATAAVPVLRKAQLAADRAFDAPLVLPPGPSQEALQDPNAFPLPEEPIYTVHRVLDGLHQATGKAFIVLGIPRLAAPGTLQGKPAREVMASVAKAAGEGWEWQQFEEFYLLFPPEMPRHEARPVSLGKRNPALRRKIPATTSSPGLTGEVLALGAGCSVPLIVGVVGNEPRFANRCVLPCVIAAKDRTMDEAMQALTALTGDPWDRLEGGYVLSFSGRPLTLKQRIAQTPTISIVHFTQRLSPDQIVQMKSEEGLAAARLAPDQLHWLQIATTMQRQESAVTIDQLVLRLRVSQYGVGRFITLYASAPEGLKDVGRFTYR